MKRVLLLGAALLTAPAHANTTLQQCMDTTDTAYCQGVAEGALSAAILFKLICPAPNATYAQTAAMTIKWANEHPEQWNADWAYALTAVAAQAWPCKKTAPSTMPAAPGAF
jgi:hypothetical protein